MLCSIGPSEELAPGHPEWEALMNQCYALEPPEELAPGHPDWDATDGPMLCSRAP
jgi:hypothetical protein